MEITLTPGKYVVAVSGGIDSTVLLDVLAKRPDLDLTVAHFDHGIRADSSEDARLVARLAADYGLAFELGQAKLGPRASEAAARVARYEFLRSVRAKTGATAIITAHHLDDVLETAIFNLQRGTGRHGLTSLRSTSHLRRPLLRIPKLDIVTYAIKHNLSWREDSTNYDTRYARNYIRHCLLVQFNDHARQQLQVIIERLRTLNDELDADLQQQLRGHANDGQLDRQWFTDLPNDVAREVMMTWLRQNGLADFDRPAIERLTNGAKTRQPGKRLDVLRGASLLIGRHNLALKLAER